MRERQTPAQNFREIGHEFRLVFDARPGAGRDHRRGGACGSRDPRVFAPRARNSSYGQLTLAFLRSSSAPGGLQLYGWTAVDPQGHRTTVKLSNVRYNVAVAESAFTYAEPKKR